MNIILDLLVVAILAFTIFLGFRKGFVKSLMGLASGILALVIAFVFTPTLAAVVDRSFVRPAVVSVVEEQIVSVLPDEQEGNLLSFIKDSPAELAGFLSGIGIDTSRLESYLPEETAEEASSLESISEALAAPLSHMISSVISFIVIYVAALIILKIVTAMLDGLFSLPVLRIPNKLLGGAIGAVTGIITCLAVCSVLNVLLPYLAENGNPFFANVTAEKTLLFRFFCGLDAVREFLGTVIK